MAVEWCRHGRALYRGHRDTSDGILRRMIQTDYNHFRYAGGSGGHYESYFQRANHPSRKLAFWIRYTVFSPRGRPEDAVGELWAIYFDGERGRIIPVKQVFPYARCAFVRTRLDARIDDASLDGAALQGKAEALGHAVSWDLRYASPEAPVFLLPDALYDAPLPKAKALVGSPMAVYEGELVVDGERVAVDGWVGSQNHNWGAKHTDEYAWGQVAGFDDAPDTFLEVTTARVHVGPWKTPWLSPMVLRHAGRELRWNALGTALRTRAHYGFFRWTFDARAACGRLHGVVEADAADFVGLPYDNPPGGRKTCLNCKVARCTLTLERPGEPDVQLHTAHRAAFEILTDRSDHCVSVLAV